MKTKNQKMIPVLKFYELDINQTNESFDNLDDDEIEVRDQNEELKLSFYSMKKQFMNFVTLFVSSLIH